MLEKRERKKISALCQVFDLEQNWIGVSLAITSEEVHLVLSNPLVQKDEFSLILKHGETEQAPEVTLTISPIWHHSENHFYQEIRGKIVLVENEKEFQAFFDYSQEALACCQMSMLLPKRKIPLAC